MGADDAQACLHDDGLVVTLLNMLATGTKQAPREVVAVRSESAPPITSSTSGLPRSWDHQLVDPAAMSAIAQDLLSDRHLVLMVPPWGLPPESKRRRILIRDGAPVEPQPPGWEEQIPLAVSVPQSDVHLFVLLPVVAVRTERYRAFRAGLMAKWSITDVVVLQGAIPGVAARFECVLLGLRPEAFADGTTRFFEPGHPNDTDPSSVIADFARLQRMAGGYTDFGYVLRGGFEAGDILTHGLRDPKLQATRTDLANFGRTVALKDLFEIRRIRLRDQDFCQLDTPGAARIIWSRDVTESPLQSDRDRPQWATVDRGQLLEPGDFLTPGVTPRSNGKGFTVIAHSSCDGPAVAGPTMVVLRPRESVAPEIIDFSLRYLRSPAASRVYLKMNPEIRLGRGFDEMVVPVADEEILAALQNLRDAQSNFLEWADEAGAVIDSIFDYPSVEEARPRIIEAGRSVRSRSREARNLDDPDFAVRRAFPYPVAHRWRVMEAAVSAGSEKSVYWRCPRGHSYEAFPVNRTGYKKAGCPYCSKRKLLVGFNDLATQYPAIAKDWNSGRNGERSAHDVLPGSRLWWWTCSYGHDQHMMFRNRLRAGGCTACPPDRRRSAETELAHPALTP